MAPGRHGNGAAGRWWPVRANPAIRSVVCSKSGQELPIGDLTSPLGLCRCCPKPGKPLVFRYRLSGLCAPAPPPRRGLPRFEQVLPVQGLSDAYAGDVGDTPTVRHPALGARYGVEVWLKQEGANPSGSFKDRGLAVAVALGALCGARRFCLPTQGNAGVAASLFSARLGVDPCLVYMPEPWRDSIYHRACRWFGAEVRFAGANIAEAGRAMRQEVGAELASGTLVELSTFFEPGRLEGKKTMGYEIAEQCSPLPHWIVYPTGGGTGLVGIWKAFEELVEVGALTPADLPRMVAVQSANCAPVVEAFHRGDSDVSPVVSRGTVADGLDVPGAIMGHEMLRVLRASRGTAVAVGERAILDAFATFGRLGVAAGYESAATLAALEALRAGGVIGEGERVLLLLTATHQIALARR